MRYAMAAWCLLLLAGCDSQHDDDRPKRAVGADPSAVLTFGPITEVEGTPFFTMPIVRKGGRGADSYGGSDSGTDERNRLIIDSRTGASRRVLPNEDFELVTWIEPKPRAADTDDNDTEAAASRKPSGLYAAVVLRSGRVDRGTDTYDVLLGRFATGQQQWIARGVTDVQGVWITPEGKLAMIAAVGDHGTFRLYDPATFEQLLENKHSTLVLPIFVIPAKEGIHLFFCAGRKGGPGSSPR